MAFRLLSLDLLHESPQIIRLKIAKVFEDCFQRFAVGRRLIDST